MDDDELYAGPLAEAALRASALHWAQRDAWMLVDAADVAAPGSRLAAAGAADRSRPPALQLLAVAEWGAALEGLVTIQAIGGDLYVRTQTRRAAQSVALSARAADRLVQIEGERMPETARAFALPFLNGGGDAGALWWFAEVDPTWVLGSQVQTLTMNVALERERLTLGSVPRPASNWPDRAAPRYVADLIRAYSTADAKAFSAALDRVCRDHTGAGDRARADNNWWRRLTRWECLWVRAMLAELQARREADHYGCAVACDHPQLGMDRL